MECSKCGGDKILINKHFKLCLSCNNERLHGSKFGKSYKSIKNDIKPVKSTKNRAKSIDRIQINNQCLQKEQKKDSNLIKDERLYEKSFNLSDHKCEECLKPLPDRFRDDDGKIIARWRYSHIIPKSVAPQLRHKVENINNLCLEHHEEWENGDKKSMKIWADNCKKFPQYLSFK